MSNLTPDVGNFESEYFEDSMHSKDSHRQNIVEKYTLKMHSIIIVPALQMLYDGKIDKANIWLKRCIVPILKQATWTRSIFFEVLNASLQGLEKEMANEIHAIIVNIYYQVRPVFTLKF